MSPRLRLQFAVQALAVMVGIAGACAAVLIGDALGPDEAPTHARLATTDATPPPSWRFDFGACERGYSSVDSLAGDDARLDDLSRSREQAMTRCRAALGEDAPACSPEAIMPLELAVCLVEEQAGEGSVKQVELLFDKEREQILWLIGDRRRAYRIYPG